MLDSKADQSFEYFQRQSVNFTKTWKHFWSIYSSLNALKTEPGFDLIAKIWYKFVKKREKVLHIWPQRIFSPKSSSGDFKDRFIF